MIETGKTVTWVSQAQGGYTEKKGTVIAIIKPEESAMRFVPKTAKKSHIKFQDKSQMERVLVEVPTGKDGNIQHYYCPRLSVVETQQNQEPIKKTSKSIFVIDTPICCKKCPMFGTGACEKWCERGTRKFPKKCPLKEAPVKRAERGYTLIHSMQYLEGYDDGYNACIDNILKESDKMRLIDADKLIEAKVGNDPVAIAAKCAPTAYDADKVVEQLEELRDRFTVDDFHIRGILEKAIAIVKLGGLNEQ